MRRQAGLSLVELMISITLGLILMTGVMQLFLASRETFATQQAVARIQENGRLAMEFMARDIRMAGYMGCASRGNADIVNGLDSDASGDYRYDLMADIRGYDHDDSPLDAGIDVADDTDVLVVRTAGSTSLNLLQPASGTANIVTAGEEATEDCVGDICRGDTVVLADCTQGRIFQIQNLEENSGQIRIVHATNSYEPGNATSTWDQYFEPGSEVIRKTTVTYYIADSNVNPGTPALWQVVGSNDPVELMEGVEDMRLVYGRDTDSDGVPNSYQEADGISAAGWAQVLSVRIELLVRSIDDNVLDEPQAYSFAGETIDVGDADHPGDRRLRQVFVNTVGIRSRLQ